MDGIGGYFWNAAKALPDIAQNVKCALKDIVIASDDEMPNYANPKHSIDMKSNQTRQTDPIKASNQTTERRPMNTMLKVPAFGKNINNMRESAHHMSINLNDSELSRKDGSFTGKDCSFTRKDGPLTRKDSALPFQNPVLSTTTVKQMEALTPVNPVPQKSLLKLNTIDRPRSASIESFAGRPFAADNPYTLTLEPSIHRLKSGQPSLLEDETFSLMHRKTYNQCKIHTNCAINNCCRTCDFLPLCNECIKSHGGHTITTLSEGVGDVVEIFRECLSVVVDRHNVLESLLPEIRHYSAKSETILKNAKRSIEKSTACLLDVIKAKEDSANNEIHQLLNVGSEKLNSLHKDSVAYSKYILERLKTLENLEKMSETNVGLALNTFIDLKPEYERLIYQCQDIPLLGQPLIQHWHITPGNIQNLLATEETYITKSSRKISNSWIAMDNKIKEMAHDLEKGKYQYALPVSPTLEPPLLVGTFLRRDWKRKEWLQRVVTIRPPLLLIHAHPDDPNEKVETSFKISELYCELFENSNNPYVIEARRQHSHGLHLQVISDQTEESANLVLLASSSSSIPRIWIQALKELKNSQVAEGGNVISSGVREEASPNSPLSFLKYARSGVLKYSIEQTGIDNQNYNKHDAPDVCRSPVHFSERQFTTESDKNDNLHVPKLTLSESIDNNAKNTISSRSIKDSDPYSLNREWSMPIKSLNRNKQKSKLFEQDSDLADKFDFSQIPQFVCDESENDPE